MKEQDYRGDGIEARADCDGFDRRVPKFRVLMHAYVDISQNGRYAVIEMPRSHFHGLEMILRNLLKLEF